MSERTLTKFKILSIAIFILGLVSAAFAFSLRQTNGKKPRHRKGFTVITKETAILINGGRQLVPEIFQYTRIRYQRSDGAWKDVRVARDATGKLQRKDITVGVPGQGVFKVNRNQATLDFLSSMQPSDVTSYVPTKNWYRDPHFLKDDWVQGYQTHVLRFPDPEGGYVDMYFAPELDDALVRRVDVMPAGVAVEELFEVKFGEPDENSSGMLPGWLVKYDQFKQKIASLEESGQHQTADALRRELTEQIAKQPE